MSEERVRRDGEVEVVAAPLPGGLADDANEHVVLGLGGREGREHVLARKERGALLQRREIERARPPELAPRLER